VFSNHYFRRCRPIAVLVLVVLLGLAVPICYPRDASSTKTETLGLRVSDTGHYLLKDGAPFFWLGDTAWSLVNRYSREEAEDYLERRRKQGFSVEHIMLLFDGGPGITTPATNSEGAEPFLKMNPDTPNEAYFRNVDELIRLALRKDLTMVILACGGSGGSFVKKKKIITKENARNYGKWLGLRYGKMPNIIWANGFDLKPWDHEEVAKEFAAGLREGDGGSHLITYHPSGGASSSYFHRESWLDLNIIQTWADYLKIYPMVTADYLRVPRDPWSWLKEPMRRALSIRLLLSRRCLFASRPIGPIWRAGSTATVTMTFGGRTLPGERRLKLLARARWVCSKKSSPPVHGGSMCRTSRFLRKVPVMKRP
jgi:hypothetical protein